MVVTGKATTQIQKRSMLWSGALENSRVVVVMAVELDPMRTTPSVPRFVVLNAKFANLEKDDS